MNAPKHSEESTQKMQTEGQRQRTSYISFHETVPESNSHLQAASDKSNRDKTLEAEAALKWETLAYDHYVIIQGEEYGREREHRYLSELGKLKDESNLHSEHLELKTQEMMKAAHGEQEQHNLLLSEVKELHVQRVTAQRLREENNILGDC